MQGGYDPITFANDYWNKSASGKLSNNGHTGNIYIMHNIDDRSAQENKKPKQTNFFLENKNGVSKSIHIQNI